MYYSTHTGAVPKSSTLHPEQGGVYASDGVEYTTIPPVPKLPPSRQCRGSGDNDRTKNASGAVESSQPPVETAVQLILLVAVRSFDVPE